MYMHGTKCRWPDVHVHCTVTCVHLILKELLTNCSYWIFVRLIPFFTILFQPLCHLNCFFLHSLLSWEFCWHICSYTFCNIVWSLYYPLSSLFRTLTPSSSKHISPSTSSSRKQIQHIIMVVQWRLVSDIHVHVDQPQCIFQWRLAECVQCKVYGKYSWNFLCLLTNLCN